MALPTWQTLTIGEPCTVLHLLLNAEGIVAIADVALFAGPWDVPWRTSARLLGILQLAFKEAVLLRVDAKQTVLVGLLLQTPVEKILNKKPGFFFVSSCSQRSELEVSRILRAVNVTCIFSSPGRVR